MPEIGVIRSEDLIAKDAAEVFEKLNASVEKNISTIERYKKASISLGNAIISGAQDTERAERKVLKYKEEYIANSREINTLTKQSIALEKELAIAKSNTTKNTNAQINSFQKLKSVVLQIYGAYALAMQVLSSASKLKDTVENLDKFRFAMEKITNSQYGALDSMRFLIKVSNDYGISLEEATDRYSKFFAAAEQSNLSLQDTREIFETMAKVSGVLGLKTDEVRGVFLALEQMLSKGKVTTEELRRQLGERLPGAFGIMADAVQKVHPELDVTLSKLDDMLKKGQVITKDVLVEFAKQVEIAFGIETTDKVETLIASEEKFSTAWTNMIFEIENGSNVISKTFKFFYDTGSKALNEYTSTIKILSAESITSIEKWKIVAAKTIPVIGQLYGNQIALSKERIDELEKEYEAQQDHNALVEDYSKLMFGINKDLGNNISLEQVRKIALELTTDQLKEQLNVLKEKNELEKESQKLIPGTIAFYKEAISNERKYQEENLTSSKADRERAESGKEAIKIWESEIKKLDLLTKAKKENNKEAEKMKQLLKDIAEFEEKEAAAGFKMFSDIAVDFTAKFLKVSNTKIKDVSEAVLPLADIENDLGPDDDMLKVLLETNAKTNGLLFVDTEKLYEQYKKLYGDDYDNYKKFIDKKKQEQDKFLDASYKLAGALFDISGSLLDSKLESINAEINAEEEKYDRLYQLAEGDKDLQDDINEQKIASLKRLEAEELRIRRKKARNDKLQSLFEIGVNTASAITEALPNIPLSILVGALGAAQALAVLLKPLPKYGFGRKDGPAEWAILGERGRKEVIEKKDGRIMLTQDKATLSYLENHDKVYPSREAYMHSKGYSNSVSLNYDKIEESVKKGIEKASINNNINNKIYFDIDYYLWRNNKINF